MSATSRGSGAHWGDLDRPVSQSQAVGVLLEVECLRLNLPTLDAAACRALTDEQRACGERRWVRYEVDYCQYGGDMVRICAAFLRTNSAVKPRFGQTA